MRILLGFLAIYMAFSSQIFAEGKVKVDGKISSDSVTEVHILADPFVTPFEEAQTVEVKNGKFTFSVQLESSVKVELRIKGYNPIHLYLQPDKNLSITDDGMGSFIFSGDDGEAQVLHDFRTKFYGQFGQEEMHDKIVGSAIDMYELELFGNRNAHRKEWKEVKSKVNLSADFVKYMDYSITYNYLSLLACYPTERARANPKSSELRNLPSIMEEEFKEELLNVDEAMFCPEYRSYVDYYIIYETSKANDFKKFLDYSESYLHKERTAQMKLEGNIYAWYVAQLLYGSCERANPAVVKKLYGNLKMENEAYAETVYERCGEWMETKVEKDPLTANIKKGKLKDLKASDDAKFAERKFVLADQEGNPVSLKEFRGKVVYIDFWASWCGPCVRQFPYSKKLHDGFTKKQLKDMVFLYISLDDSEDRWKNAIKKHGLEGVQTLLKGGWNSEGAQHYRINSIPRYMLMNKKGEIVDTNAPRPSMEGIQEKLLELLAD